MKNNFTFFLFLFLSTGLFGQVEPIEKVEFEPDPIMMDAYDFATGRMNEVKWMVKATVGDGTKLGIEYKLSKAISANLTSSGIFGLFSLIGNNPVNFNNSLSLRYYLKHQERIDNGLQGNNLNGTYVELGTAINLPLSFNIYQNPFIGFGMQSRFLKRGLVDTGVRLSYNGDSNNLNLSTGFSIGLAFSNDYDLTEIEENKCAIVRCYDEQFYMIKVPISGLLSLSLSNEFALLNANPSIELEHRLTRVSITMNHELRSSFELFHNPNGQVGIVPHNFQEVSYRAGIRWYVGKKKRIIKGKTSNNLSGFYLGPIGEFGIAGGKSDLKNFAAAEFYSGGFQYGYQTRLLKNLYFNLSFGLMLRDYYNLSPLEAEEFVGIRNTPLTISDPSMFIEFVPIGGVIVGYTF